MMRFVFLSLVLVAVSGLMYIATKDAAAEEKEAKHKEQNDKELQEHLAERRRERARDKLYG